MWIPREKSGGTSRGDHKLGSGRPGIGCGCVHGHADPRGFDTILAEADRIFASVQTN